MDFVQRLRSVPIAKNAWYAMKSNSRERRQKRNYEYCIHAKYRFIDRSHGYHKLCILLAGYKTFLYDTTFARLKAYMEKGMDVCVITSGMYSEMLAGLCRENGWSYLGTEKNNIALVQNLAIHLHPRADLIFKLDEDIFVTENCFSQLSRTLEMVEQEDDYIPCFVAPLIPVNGYSYKRILKKLQLEDVYEQLFEKPRYAAGAGQMIENNPDVARFFWGEGGFIPQIDELNQRFSQEEFTYSVCPIRFSIGAILFRRSVWEEMGMYTVNPMSISLGCDEDQLCGMAVTKSKAMIVAENTVVGHLAFGPQNAAMKEYYLEHKERFALEGV